MRDENISDRELKKSREFFNQLDEMIERFSHSFPVSEAIYILMEQAVHMGLSTPNLELEKRVSITEEILQELICEWITDKVEETKKKN